ncbi:hypothetical protein LP416_04695 [Polaromonas sp. P2-4]|nr:hypothetical protein LP416_04695 [Polaromonas sp. P2-4]
MPFSDDQTALVTGAGVSHPGSILDADVNDVDMQVEVLRLFNMKRRSGS